MPVHYLILKNDSLENHFALTMPVVVAHAVAIKTGMIMLVGFGSPALAKIAIAVAGMSCTLPVLIATNIHIASDAVPGVLLSLLSSSIAFNPKGVAALANPKTLAEIFKVMAPNTGWSRGICGNKKRSIGLMNFAKPRINPASSAMRISPNHKAIIPISPKAKTTALPAESV